MERPSGRYYEELEIGQVFKHPLSRTVTETDNLLITTLTMNTQPLHLDEEFCKEHSITGTRLVNSVFTLGLVLGLSVSDVSHGTTLGNLGFKEVSFPAPVSIGDTLRAETQILSKRLSTSRPTAGIVEFEHRGYNQNGVLIAKIHRIGLMLKMPTT
jgi:acyl dehydratase